MNKIRINKLLTQANINNADGFLLSNQNNMIYFSEYTGEGVVIISENGCAIITDGRYTEQAGEQSPNFEVIEFERGKYESTIKQSCEKYSITSICYEADEMTCDAYNRLSSAFGSINLVPTKAVGTTIRKIKDDEELKIMQRAANVTDELLEFAHHLTKPGISELDLESELFYIMSKKYEAKNAFSMIIAGGEHGSMPHAVTGNRILQKNEMVTLDFGAALNGYKSDMTRTYAIGEPNEKMNEIYEIVKEAQQLAQDALKPGTACKDIDKIARDYISKHGYGENFGHGLGHGVGLDIHEYPLLNSSSNDVLQENMVVTVEPGIYLPGIGGVRIENTCVITKDSGQSLFKATTKMIKI